MTTAGEDDIVQEMKDLCQLMQYGEWEEVDLALREQFSGKLPNTHVSAHQTILHVAAMSAAPEGILTRLLEKLDVDFCCQPDVFGDTPLHLVCRSGIDPATIQLLALHRPQDFMRKNTSGETPCDKLMSRVNSDYYELYESDVTAILVAVARVNCKVMSLLNQNRESLLHRAIPHSFSYEDFVLIRTLLCMNPKLINATDYSGAAPAHRAARENDLDAASRLKVLVDNGGALRLKDSDGKTPLDTACRWGSTREVIETLVMSDPSALQVRNGSGMTPLATFHLCNDSFRNLLFTPHAHWSDATLNNVDILMTLLTGTPLRSSDSPSLHELLRNEQCTLVFAEILIYALRDQASVQDSNGNVPLHVIALKTPDDNTMYLKVLEMLLRLYPQACQVSNRERQLPLELMLQSGKTWNSGMKLVLLEHPAAVLDLGLNSIATCAVLEKLGMEQKPEALFRLLRGAPDLIQR